MGQLRYYKRSYFRSAETDVASFRPYLVKIVWIILITFVAYGIQNLITTGDIFSSKETLPITNICHDSKTGSCPATTNVKLGKNHL